MIKKGGMKMKNGVKKIMAVLFSIIFVLGMTVVPINASQYKHTFSVKGMPVDKETIDYAKGVFPKHLCALMSCGELEGNMQQYSLGEAFTVFNVVDDTYTECFPVLKDGEFTAVLEVLKDGTEYNSSLAVSFADELKKFICENENKQYVLLSDGNCLEAYDGENSYKIYEQYGETNENLFERNLSRYFHKEISTLSINEVSNYTDEYIYTASVSRNLNAKTSSRTLDVKGVPQGKHPWCWAATCAAMINYLEKENLSASDVANYVFPNNPEQGGNWTNMKKAYNHWNVYPFYNNIISFSKVKTNINSGVPMHLMLDGHSVGLIGYQDWTGVTGGNNEQILILLEPNGGVHKSVALNSSGNFKYDLGGGEDAWIHTIEF